MPKESISQSVSQLQARKQVLENDIAEIDSRLRAIAKVLNADKSALTPKSKRASADGRGGRPAARSPRKAHRWFAAAEAVSLMKRHVARP